MIPADYFPLPSPTYDLRIGASPMGAGSFIFEKDDWLEEELLLKKACLDFDANYYCQWLPGSEAAQRELASLVGSDPQLGIRGAGDMVQEDLLILDLKQTGLPLIAGHLCFANAWCLDEKLGLPFLAIHGPVPEFSSTIGPSSEKLIERLKHGRPVVRLNWAVKSSGQMDLTSRWNEFTAECNAKVTAENAGGRCWMRAERQTLSLLGETGAVLFTVHTYMQTVETLMRPQQEILLGVLQTCPEPMLRYKGIWPFARPLMQWLSR